MIKKLGLIKDYYEEEQTLTKFNPREEYLFQKAYKEMATKQGLSLDPDDPKHFYDYRALYKATGKLEPDKTGHFPSKYKLEGHPRMYIEGVKTKEEEKPGVAQRTRGIGELPKYEIPKVIKTKPLGDIGLGMGAESKAGIELPGKPGLGEGIFKPPKIKKLGLIKKEIKPEEEDFSLPINRIKYYESKINWLEGIAEKKDGFDWEGSYDAYEYAINQYNKAIDEYNIQAKTEYKHAFKKYKQLTGLPGEAGVKTPLPEPEKPEIPSYWGIHELDKPEQMDKIQKGIISVFGTWEAKKKAMPELQNVEDFGNEVFKQGDRRNQIAYIHEALTGVSREETLKEMEVNFEKFKDINPDIDERTWKEYYKEEGLWKTLITGPSKGKYDEAIKLRNQLIDIAQKVAEPGKDIIGQLGWSGMVVLMGTQLTSVLYGAGLKVKDKMVAGENLKATIERAKKAYIPETGKFKSSLSQNDLAVVNRLKDIYRVTGGKIENVGLVKEWGVTEKGMKIPQVTFLYAGLPPDEIVNSLVKTGKITADIAKELSLSSPEKVTQIIDTLSKIAPVVFSELKSNLEKLIPQKTFTGKAYRAESHIPEHGAEIISKMKTAQEKLDYDYGTTGNPIFKEAGELTKNLGIDLSKVPIKDMLWVTKDLEIAQKYGKAKEITIPEDNMVLMEDDEGGSLILKNIQKYREPVTVSLEEEGRVEALWAGKKEPIIPEEGKKPIIEPAIVPETLEKQSIFLYDKPFKELNKAELNKVLETTKQPLPDETGEYINKIGTPAKGLELRPTADEHARFIFGGYDKGLLTDGHLLVLDKEVSKKILSDLIEKYKKARIKEVQTAEVSYKEAQGIVDKEVEGYKKEYAKQFPETEKIVPKEDIEKSTPLWLQGHQVTELGPPITILTDGKIQIAVDTNKLAFLNKNFPNAEIKATGVDKPVLFMEEGKLKAMVMPIRVEEYPFKITGEPTIMKPAEELPPGEVEPTIKKISKVRPTITTKPKTYDLKADLSTEQRIEGNKIIGRIHGIVSSKGLTKIEFISLKQKYGLSPHLATDTRRMTMPQLQAVLKAVERVRPKRIGYQKVITRKTEGKIQSLKDSLIEKYQMTEKAYEDTLKDLGIYKEPRYIDAKHFITEEKGKELIYRLIDEAEILKITEPLRIALEKNPEIKRLADIIDERVRLEGERTVRDPHDWNSARNYFQILETISGAPFFTLYQDLINCHLENRAGLNHLIADFNEYRDIIKDGKELKKTEDWILAKSDLKGKPETPINITPKEVELAKKIEGILKDYQSRARTEKFLDNLENLKNMPQYLQYKKEIDKAKDIYESKGYDELVKYMKDQKFGVRKSGYDPIQVVSAKVRAVKAKGLSMIFGKSHIQVRKDIEYKEQDINIITRVIAYKRQMDNLSMMAPKVRALITLANKNLDKFKNPNRVRKNLEVFFRELKGYDRTKGWWERGINRIYAQAMITIIMGSPPLAFRNLGQNIALGHDKAMLIDPRNKKLTPDDIVYLDTYVQQAIFMQTDWFLTGEKPLPGLKLLTDIIKKINLYPRSDVANRLWGFWAKINQVRMAFEGIDKNSTSKEISKAMIKAKFSDFSLLEQKRALEIFAKDGLKEMDRYVSKCYVDDVHFLYERAQRSLAEMGPYGIVFGNLMLFPRAYWEKLVKFSKKMTGKNVPPRERARAFKVIANIIIGGILVSSAFKKVTGRRKSPYDPLELLAYEPGGLMLSTVGTVSEVYIDFIMATKGDEKALSDLTTSLPALADMFIPFYNYTLRGLEAATDTKNIDRKALRKLRMLIDREYAIRGGAYILERNSIEKWQYFLSGAGVDVAIAERKRKEKEAAPILIGKPKIPKLGIPKISKPGIPKLSPIKKF